MSEIGGVLNPAFLYDETVNSHVGSGHKPLIKSQTDPINGIPGGKRRRSKSESAPTSDHDVKITITDDKKKDEKDEMTLSQQDSTGTFRPLTRRRRPGTFVDSLRKAENPPPLDEEYLRRSLKFSEERIK